MSPKNHNKEKRDELRRSQIVEAAMNCVCRHGFHKATTAMIAKEAGFSEGQLYRYFPSKEAIIAAIAESLTRRHLARIIRARTSSELAEIISREMTDDSPERNRERILFMEIRAEATRNQAMAEILQKSDQRLKDKALESTLSEFPHLGLDKVVGITELLATISEGRIMRSGMSDPENTRQFLNVYKAALAFLLSENSGG